MFYAFLQGDHSLEIPEGAEQEDKKSLPLDRLRVQVLDIDKENELLICQPETLPQERLTVRYNVSANEIFNPTIDRLWIGAQLNLM